ncbi:MAG: AAA family ATPase [Candidatus Micrarchaeota archaeon]
MRGKLFKDSQEHESVFAQEDALSPEFVPDALPGRENELSQLAFELKPAIRKSQTRALFLWGPPGTGKTGCSKFVLRELTDYSDSVYGVYVNCWGNYTKQSVFSVLSQSLGQALPRRGLASDEVFARVAEAVRNEGKTVIVVLDEVDRLFHSGAEEVLYDLSRARETHGACFGVIALTNDKTVLARLDARTRSSLRPFEMEFAKYSPVELKQILGERAETAFRKNACSPDAIALTAAHAAKNGGDARIAIQTLWEAGKNADYRNSRAVEEQDVKKAINERELNASQEKRLAGLSKAEQDIISALENGSKESGELYAALKKTGLTDRSIRNYLSLLENKRLVESEKLMNEKGKPGLTRRFKLSF